MSITTVILSAIVPIFLAPALLLTPVHPLTTDEIQSVEDEDFEPAR